MDEGSAGGGGDASRGLQTLSTWGEALVQAMGESSRLWATDSLDLPYPCVIPLQLSSRHRSDMLH